MSSAMHYALLAVAVLLAIACSEAEPENEVFSVSGFFISPPGEAVAAACTEVGAISVPAREVSIVGRLAGAGIRDFAAIVSRRMEALAANHLVASGAVNFFEAAETGSAFTATAFRCPE